MTYRPATRAAQALGWIDEQTGALTPPLHPSSTFLRDADNQYRRGFSYGRDSNPGYRQVEALLSELEEAADSLLFASGMAAATAVFQALPSGSRVLAQDVMYWALRRWLFEFGEPMGLVVELLPCGDLQALERALAAAPTALVWLETPANPLWTVTDIAAASRLAHAAGALLCVDSTAASPVVTRPLTLGADLVMHSATKYLNGHSDVIAGTLSCAAADALWQRIRRVRQGGGAILGAFDSWLLLRGMRTMYLRVDRASASAQILAQRLSRRPGVSVLYPGLASGAQLEVAKKQMHGGFGGMLSLRLAAGAGAAVAVAAQTRLWKRATSLGGVESLIEHRASIEGDDSPVPEDLLRLSVGIEDVDDLFDDLDTAFSAAGV